MLSPSQVSIHKLFRNSWKWIFILIILAPIMKWFFILPVAERFTDIESTAKALGQVAGIVGTLLFSFSLILSYRNRVTETMFGGLDTLYRIHHLFGMYGLFILLAHPLLLSVPRLMYSVEDGARFFIPFQTSTAVDFGIFSILSFMILIGVTLFGVIFSYQALKKFHVFLGFAFLLGAVHGFLISGDMQNDMFIRYWVLGFAFFGVIMYVIHSFLKKYFVHKNLFSVASVTKKEGGITELILSPTFEGVTHLPGQFGFFSFSDSLVVPKESHPFTISTWKGDGSLGVSVKALGDFTTSLANERVGTSVLFEGPFGEFSYLYGDQKQVWVAGGVGVTPFVSFAEHALSQDSFPYTVDFFYSIRTKADAAYSELFEKVAQKFPTFMYHPMPSDTDGYITGELVVEKVPGVLLRDIFICGPPPMMKALIASLTHLGIKSSRIHSELFSLLK